MADTGSGPAEGREPTMAGDPETLAMMRRIEATLFDASEAPVRVGRFALGRVLGSGGMGVVHLAHDDVLDRRVAVKLIRSERVASDDLRTRLLREARAMARLSHGNVVQVYEAGEHDGRIYVVMELVEGHTLARWLEEDGAARTWRERLAVVSAAGRGLAAAHRVGLVHRDFKPDNVLLDGQGGVKVADFGLVGVTAEATSTAPRELDRLTITGSLVGTPRYMAPEQLMGQPVDARSDQFAFCIVAYEALVGERPFAGDTFVQLSESVTAGALRSVPRGCPVPRSVLATIERGLDPDPERRWPSMDELLAAMNVRRGRVRSLAAVAAVALVPALALAALGLRDEAPGCEGGAERLAGVWDPARREQTRAAFQATGKAYANEMFAIVAPVLDAYASAWSEADLSACTLARSGAPTDAARVACLDHARTELRFVADDLVAGDPSTLMYADELVGVLPELVRCEDPERAQLDVGSLEDAEVRAIVDGLGHAKMLVVSRRLTEADAELVDLQSRGAALRRDALEAHALLLRAKAAHIAGAWERERDHASQALALAERAEREEIAARAWQAMTDASRELHEYERAAFELDRADAILARDETNVELRAELLYDRATLLGLVGRHGEAIESYRRALEVLRAVDPEHPLIIDVLVDMSKDLRLAGEQDEAVAAVETAVRERAKQLGDTHPRMVGLLLLAANQYTAVGRFEDVLSSNRRALELAQLYPEQRPDLIPTLAALVAQAQIALGRFDEGEEMLEQAEILANRHAPEAPHIREYIAMALGNLHLDRQQFELAAPQYERALELERGSGNRPLIEANLAYALAQLGRSDDALAHSAAAMAGTTNMGVEAAPRVGIEINDAEVSRLVGRTEEAREKFGRVLAVVDRVEIDPSIRFMAYFGAAQVEPEATRAREYARKAGDALERMPGAAWQHEAFAAWSAEHDGLRPRG